MQYKVGDYIKIKKMVGEPLYSGRKGYVEYVDSAGLLHGTWGDLAIIPWKDEIEYANEDGLNRVLLHSGILVGVFLVSMGILSSDIVPVWGKLVTGFIFGAVAGIYSAVSFGILRRG